MTNNVLQIIIFYYVVDFMSFSKAALYLGLSKAHVSKQISELERSMQTKLLERTTRRLKLTFAGEQLYEHSRKIVLEYHHAEQTIASLQETPKGVLRVTAPSAYAAHILSDKLPSFLKMYPDVQLDLDLTGDVLDLLEAKIDIAIRLTHTPPQDRVAKLIGNYQLQVCASTAYLEKNAIPKHPHELTQHSCLVYATVMNSERWPFVIDEREIKVDVNARLSANTYQTILQATLDGCGIARLPSYVIKEEVEKNNLTLLFSDQMPANIPIYAIYAQSVFTPPKVKVFIEFLLGPNFV